MFRPLLLVCVIVFALSAQPVATLTTGGYVKVNGTVIPTTAAPNWPLAASDEIVTAEDVAVITFPDGVRVTLAKSTRVTLRVCDRCVVQLYVGAVTYKMPVSSKLQVCALGHPIKPAPETEGSVSIGANGEVFVQVVGQAQVEAGKGQCACEAGAPWLGSHKTAVVIIAGAAAAATVAAIAVTRPGARSPSTP
ncbi:MAG: hypothetical protein ABSE56_08755 [Bryobacteraceae bacterium]|jgi:hypothetical protein